RMVDRLMASFNDILEMLRINEGRIALRPASFDLSNLVKKVLEELEAFIEQRRLQVTVEVPPELYVTADPEKIELVLINIIQNAIKFTFDDGDIVIRATHNGHNEAHILIRDSGIGIDQVEIKRIFETFYTSSDPSTHTSGKYEFSARGTGLGLSIARSYIEAHGGRVWAESEGKGHGSTFHIILPVEVTTKPKNEE
ncbi:MAG TPA: HAMP domain-containing sensor histidine kinase, partial [Acidobacteriota bacterium]|nr:HAMP domain-containing sensor histidine kinase [Acidobacteriota bacterium]